MDIFRTNLAATFCDIAEANAVSFPQFFDSVLGVERMHFERSDMDQKARTDELVMLAVVAQDMANVLAKEAFDAFPELFDPIDVRLFHSPGAIGCIRRPRLERFNFLFNPKIPRHIRDQILDNGKRFDWLDPDRILDWQIAQSRHAH